MLELNYRYADKQDLKKLQDLASVSYGQFRGVIPDITVDKWESNFRNDETFLSLLKIATCIVAEHENKIIGMAFLVAPGNPILYFKPEWTYIRLLAVHPEYEGNGIGKEITRKCMQLAKDRKEKIIALHTSEFQNAARAIYEGLGFTKSQEFELYEKKYWIYTLAL